MTETEIQRLVVRLVGDSSSYKQMVNQAISASSDMSRGIENNLGNITQTVAKVTAGLASIGFAVSTLKESLALAGKFEQTTIAFETMLGSAEETKKTLQDLTTFAAKTPFEMPEIESAARGLIQFGERGDELMDTLNLLGNAAAGSSTPFGFLALVFNQVRGVGKLLTQDFRQLSTRGIISLQDIASYYKVSTNAAQEMLSKGKVSFNDLKSIFREMSKEGGRFANLMEKQSESLDGLKSTFKDAIGIAKRQLGEGLLPAMKAVVKLQILIVDTGREWVERNKELASSIALMTTGVIVATGAWYGLGIAAKFTGISIRSALGFGSLLIAIGTILGYLVTKFKLMDKAAELVKYIGDNFHYVTRAMRTAGILLTDLWNSISTFIVEVWNGTMIIVTEKWGAMFNNLRAWIKPMQTWFLDAFQVIVANLDVMLGSWEGLGAGIKHIWNQTWFAIQSGIEIMVNFLSQKILEAKGLFRGWFDGLRTSISEVAMPILARFFMWFHKKWVESHGQTWKLTGAEEARIIQEDQQRMIDKLNGVAQKNKNDNDAALENLEKEHQRKLSEIGKKSIEEQAEWEKKKGGLPRLTDRVKEAWEKAKEAAEVANSATKESTKKVEEGVGDLTAKIKELKREIGVEAVSWDSAEVMNARMLSARTKPTVAQSQSGYTANEEALIGLRGTLGKLDRNRVRRSLQNPQTTDFTGGYALPTPIPTPEDAMGELHPSMQFPASEGELALVGLMEKLVEINQKQLDKTPEFEAAGLGAGT